MELVILAGFTEVAAHSSALRHFIYKSSRGQ